ncbi:16484_t:CDS:10 [Funneliformis geosporum]|nr:16484_t:CDS:10 [Funneliformis geosporum]
MVWIDQTFSEKAKNETKIFSTRHPSNSVRFEGKPDRKELLLIESGIRIHTTQFSRDKSITPSTFCIKLRKHIRTRRLINVRQLGVDRIIDFEFAGATEGSTYHIIAEFYASGNIIFTDQDYNILTLIRIVQHEQMIVGQKYNVNTVARVAEPVTRSRLQEALTTSSNKEAKEPLRKILNNRLNSEHFIALETGFKDADRILEESAKTKQKGYIIMLHHSEHTSTAAVDEYYSSMESQKLIIKQRNQEKAALKKLEAIKKEQYSRVENLQNAQLSNIRKARLIESNVDMVDQAILVIRNAIATSIDWKDLENLVLEEKKKKNPLAEVIVGFKLESNQITLLLREYENDDEAFYDSSDTESENENNTLQPTVQEKVDVDIYLSAFANARKYYDVKKQSASKQVKTLAAADKAFKSAEQKIKQDLKETKITASINKIRKPFWFEKFFWFISSENYLVIAGHDMQQNELIVKKHLRKGDLYVHADLHGAASVVIKNPNEGQPIPPSTLFQAGIMSVCQSKAWEAKIITSAYWVNADQVSKTAPTGEYLTTGSFMIRGKKNFLPPVQLVYGFGLLFRLDEQSIANHLHERRPIRNEEEVEVDDNIQAPKEEQEIKEESLNGDDINTPGSDGSSDDTSPAKKVQYIDKSKWDKYNLDEYGVDQDEAVQGSEKLATKKKYISVKERKVLKKQKQVIIGDTSFEGLDSNQQTNKKDSNVAGKEKQTKQSSQLPRAPKNKGKKGKKESINQNASKPNNREKNISSPCRIESQDISSHNPEAEQDFNEQELVCFKNICLLHNQNTRRKHYCIGNRDFDTLTGLPLPEDNLLFAVPVCAPYISLQKYKYKVKLTPGQTKKGKACKTATSFFLSDPQLTPREKELIKSVPDTEMISVMLGKCKVSAPNIEQAKKVAKKAAKVASKEAAASRIKSNA